MCSCNQRAVQVSSSYTPSYRSPMKRPSFVKTKIPITGETSKASSLAKKVEIPVKSKTNQSKMALSKPTKFPNIGKRR